MNEKEEADADLAEVLLQFTNLIMNERVRAYNEGVDTERERCAEIAEHLNGWGNPPAPELAAHIAKIIRDDIPDGPSEIILRGQELLQELRKRAAHTQERG